MSKQSKIMMVGTFSLAASFIAIAEPVKAENLNHLTQLLSTRSCQQCDLSRSGLSMADLAQVDLQGANLQGANLSRANLQGANLRGANLSGASLYGANLAGADLTNAKLLGTDLQTAYLAGALMENASVTGAHLQGAIGLPPKVGSHVDFHNWGVVAAQAGRNETAIQNFNQAIALKPDFALSYMTRAAAYQNMGNSKAALKDAQTAEVLFKAQGDEGSSKNANAMVAVLEESLKPKSPEGGGSGFFYSLGTVFQSLAPMLLRLLPL